MSPISDENEDTGNRRSEHLGVPRISVFQTWGALQSPNSFKSFSGDVQERIGVNENAAKSGVLKVTRCSIAWACRTATNRAS